MATTPCVPMISASRRRSERTYPAQVIPWRWARSFKAFCSAFVISRRNECGRWIAMSTHPLCHTARHPCSASDHFSPTPQSVPPVLHVRSWAPRWVITVRLAPRLENSARRIGSRVRCALASAAKRCRQGPRKYREEAVWSPHTRAPSSRPTSVTAPAPRDCRGETFLVTGLDRADGERVTMRRLLELPTRTMQPLVTRRYRRCRLGGDRAGSRGAPPWEKRRK